MTFAEIIELLPAQVIYRGSDFSEFIIRNIVAGDLMSDVLVIEYDDLVMMSSLNSEQTLRTADMVGARGILMVNGKVPNTAMKIMAEEEDITLLTTPLSMFDACITIGNLLGLSGPVEMRAMA